MSVMVVGSRGSQLALRQTQSVVDALSRLSPEIEFRVRVINTVGDRTTDVPLSKISERGLFVKDIENALIRGEIDFAVHSAKDVPSETHERLMVAAYPEREDPSDALVSRLGRLDELPAGAAVGTSSVRRRAQLLHARLDLNVADLRGNLDTRLRKLDQGQYEAIVVASAGLRRMGWEFRISQALPYDVCLPAAGQGALAVQCRRGDPVASPLAIIDHAQTRRCVSAERALLAALGAGCSMPVAALATEERKQITLEAVVASVDGSKLVRERESGELSDPRGIGERLAERILSSSADMWKQADL